VQQIPKHSEKLLNAEPGMLVRKTLFAALLKTIRASGISLQKPLGISQLIRSFLTFGQRTGMKTPATAGSIPT
jgi:hypothetical protein